MNELLKKFDSTEFPNTHLEFTKKGVKMTVTINIPRDLVKYMAKNKVHFKEKFYVYWCSKEISKVNKFEINKTYNFLMKNLMINVRRAKIKMMEDEVKNIKDREFFSV